MKEFTCSIHGAAVYFRIEMDELAADLMEEFREHAGSGSFRSDASLVMRKEDPVQDRLPECAVRVSTVFPSSSVFAHRGKIYIHDPGNYLICTSPESLEVSIWASPSARIFEKVRYLSKHLVVKALERRGFHWIHGSSVSQGPGGGALIFTGVSGSGKTTCLLTMLENGYRMVSDDVVLLKESLVFPFYLRSMIHTGTVRRFPSLRKAFERSRYDPGADGSWVNLGEYFPVQKEAVKPVAIFNTSVWNSESSECRPSTPAKTVPRLVRNFLLESGSIFEPSQEYARAAFAAFSSIAESVPCFDLYVGRGNRSLYEAVQGALR
ncbi:MAG: hypothetical protein QFX35_01210 [Candidatus Verstraetearchaeota archaeon]|nr:hypothetical protein [Candidatus Verstraetearchaeota archaeon]